MKQAAHTLKVADSEFGAEILSDIAIKLEEAGKNNLELQDLDDHRVRKSISAFVSRAKEIYL
jgi:hypothetical protein